MSGSWRPSEEKDAFEGLADQPDDWRASLRTVGTVLIVVGLLDIGWMVHCIASGQSYSSSVNIFAVIAGILLRRGSLKTARGVAFFAAMGLGAMVFLPVFLALYPLDLVLTYVKLRPLPAAGAALNLIVPVALLVWAYRRMTAPAILAAMEEQHIEYRRGTKRPALGFLVGAAVVVLLVVLNTVMLRPYRQRAETQARAEVGEGYKLHVSGAESRWSGRKRTVEADVIAYNDDEIRQLKVTWEQ